MVDVWSATQRQDQERTHPRDNKSGNTLNRYIVMRKFLRSQTEESVENGYTRKKRERTTENKTDRRVPRHEKKMPALVQQLLTTHFNSIKKPTHIVLPKGDRFML